MIQYSWSSYGALEEAGIEEEDVLEIVREYEGENEGPSWFYVLKMTDGRWAFTESWCDYTGWDCQAGGDVWYASSEEELVRDHLTVEARNALGYPALDPLP